MRIDRKQAFVQRRGFGRWFNHADEQSARAPRRKSASAQPRADNTARTPPRAPSSRHLCRYACSINRRTPRTARAACRPGQHRFTTRPPPHASPSYPRTRYPAFFRQQVVAHRYRPVRCLRARALRALTCRALTQPRFHDRWQRRQTLLRIRQRHLNHGFVFHVGPHAQPPRQGPHPRRDPDHSRSFRRHLCPSPRAHGLTHR